MTRRIFTVTSLKGGAGKTTTSVHLGQYYAEQGKTLVVDGDPNRSLTDWARRGSGMPFTVVGEKGQAREAGRHESIIIDTQGRPDPADLQDMIRGSNMIIVPCPPEAQAAATVVNLFKHFQGQDATNCKVLLVDVPPPPQKDGNIYRAFLSDLGIPVFASQIGRLKAFRKASERGCTVDQVSDDVRRSLGWGDYQNFGKELDRLLSHIAETNKQRAF